MCFAGLGFIVGGGCGGKTGVDCHETIMLAKRLTDTSVVVMFPVTPRFYLYDFDAVLAAVRKHYQVDAAHL